MSLRRQSWRQLIENSGKRNSTWPQTYVRTNEDQGFVIKGKQREVDVKWTGIAEAGWPCTFYASVKGLALTLRNWESHWILLYKESNISWFFYLEDWLLFGKLTLVKGSSQNGSKNAILKSYFINPRGVFGDLDQMISIKM